MKWPQIVMIIIMGWNAGVALAKHGEPKDQDYNFVLTIVGIGIEAIILGAGGFWK